MNVLLRYKPDLFAEFLQPLWYDADDRPGAYMSDVGELVCVESDSDDEWYELSSDGEMPKIETKYAARSLFHVMLEDGALVEPILNCDGLDFDVNRRDPQGRTLMHSVCRNALGADVHADVESYEIREPIDGRFIANEGTGPSLFEIFHRRGGDLQARDYRGKNVLHHLLEARSLRYERAQPPFIYNTFKYILQHLPELVNSPDNHGTYPLHAALNRVREITFPTVWQKFSPIEQLVKDLLDAGARPLEIDSRGNTALHYLADSGLGERTDREPRRALFRFFCEAGVDVNARNHKGRTAIELFLDNHKVHEATLDVSMYLKDDNGGPRVQIEDDLLELFEASGARWTDVDPKGQTLLHWVARHNPWYARSRAYYLLKRGVDPRAKDKKGRTAQDVAEAAGNNTVAAVLRGWLVRTAKSQMADQA
jgi:ankyrin repeat protein